MAVSQVQNVHHFLLSDEKGRDVRTVRAGLGGEEKKLDEKTVKRGGETQITIESETAQQKRKRV